MASTIWLFHGSRKRAEEHINLIAWKRDTFVRVSTVLLETEAVETAITKFQGCRLADPTGHETIDWTDRPFFIRISSGGTHGDLTMTSLKMIKSGTFQG